MNTDAKVTSKIADLLHSFKNLFDLAEFNNIFRSFIDFPSQIKRFQYLALISIGQHNGLKLISGNQVERQNGIIIMSFYYSLGMMDRFCHDVRIRRMISLKHDVLA